MVKMKQLTFNHSRHQKGRRMNMKVIEENKPSPERMREFQQRLYEMLKRHLREEKSKHEQNKDPKNAQKDQ
jgi:hypothetical protein